MNVIGVIRGFKNYPLTVLAIYINHHLLFLHLILICFLDKGNKYHLARWTS